MNNYIHISQNEIETTIFRYTPIEYVLPVIVKGQNALSSPRKWDDPFENMLKLRKHPLRDRAYGQCWTLNEETDAAWRMYVPMRNGVRLKTTIKKLYQSLIHSLHASNDPQWKENGTIDPLAETACFIGRVQYKKEEEVKSWFTEPRLTNIGSQLQAESLLIKREAFVPENEIRLIYLDPCNNGTNDYYTYNFELSNIIEQITFDPRMVDGLYDTYSRILHKFGYAGDISRSTLYQVPKLELPA